MNEFYEWKKSSYLLCQNALRWFNDKEILVTNSIIFNAITAETRKNKEKEHI